MKVVLHVLLTKLLDKPSCIDVKCFESCCDGMSLDESWLQNSELNLALWFFWFFSYLFALAENSA